jgi:hypothetical protein
MRASRKEFVAAEELGIFKEFARSAGLDVTRSPISQPDPPDILCEVHGLGQVAFELVSLDSGDELRRMGYFQRIEEFWAEELKNAAPVVLQRHTNAQINVTFRNAASQNDRRAALANLISSLEKLGPDDQGEVFGEIPAALESADIIRVPISDGPRIREFSVHAVKFENAGWAPVGIDLSRIDAKVKKYEKGWGVRAELLAYSRWGMPFSDQMHNAAGYLAGRVPGGIFARAWIFELTSRTVVARVP